MLSKEAASETTTRFSSEQLLTDAAVSRITETRVKDPDFGFHAAAMRTRRKPMTVDGRLNILAADHPARRVTKVGDNDLAMADRRDYLARILRVLMAENVDGVMATMDIVEELLILDGLRVQGGRKPLLSGKLLIASLNRGGLAGSSWELDDPVTGAQPATCVEWNLDGAKFLLRIADDDPGSLKTVMAAAEAITKVNARKLPFFLEPLPVTRKDAGWVVTRSVKALCRVVGVASALGDCSSNLWLKLPYCDGFEAVARATTLPILLLGGESAGDPSVFLNELSSALSAASNVRGALVGRNVLYPGNDDPLTVANAVGGMIHGGWTVDAAVEYIRQQRDTNRVQEVLL